MPKGIAVADAIRIGSGHFIDSQENDFRLNFRGRRGRICSAPPDYRGIEEREWLAATASHWESLFA